MELASKVIDVRQGQEVYILPIGDIQYAGEGSSTAMTTLRAQIDWGVKHGAYFLGMGDYGDFASPSNRQRLASAALYDTASDVLELSASKLTKELYDRALKPSTNKWLGMLSGHHWYQYASGITTDMELCSMLKTQHLGDCAFVRLVFRDQATKKSKGFREGNITIWCHHGVGSGSRVSAPLNKLDQLPIYWDADIYLMGHMSKRVAAPLQRVEPVFMGNRTNPFLKHRTMYIACTGSFSRAYMHGNRHGRVARGDYVEKAMMSPASLGAIKIKIIPNWDNKGGKEGSRLWNPEISIEQ